MDESWSHDIFPSGRFHLFKKSQLQTASQDLVRSRLNEFVQLIFNNRSKSSRVDYYLIVWFEI